MRHEARLRSSSHHAATGEASQGDSAVGLRRLSEIACLSHASRSAASRGVTPHRARSRVRTHVPSTCHRLEWSGRLHLPRTVSLSLLLRRRSKTGNRPSLVTRDGTSAPRRYEARPERPETAVAAIDTLPHGARPRNLATGSKIRGRDVIETDRRLDDPSYICVHRLTQLGAWASYIVGRESDASEHRPRRRG